MSWTVGVLASATISASFLAVAVLLALNLTRSRTWRTNPLGAGTFLLYTTCGGGHLVHTIQLLDFGSAYGAAARVEYLDWHMWGWDVVTAAAGVWYWTMRRRFPDLVSGAAVFEDLRGRQRRALELHDNVVQGLARAKMNLDLGKDGSGHEAVDETLETSKRIISDLLGSEKLRPGMLKRETSTGGDAHGP